MMTACQKDDSTDPTPSIPVESSPDDFDTIDEKIEWWISHMNLYEKAGQMIQAERSPDGGQRGATTGEVTLYRLGSILNGGGMFLIQTQLRVGRTWFALIKMQVNIRKIKFLYCMVLMQFMVITTYKMRLFSHITLD
jgi:hypothetical protein